jgi:trans-aconitate methyltransferase
MRPAVAVSLVYRNAVVYQSVILALYGRHYAARYRAIADLIRPGSRVVDLCCGPGILHDRYLRRKGVDYLGLDINPRFLARVNRRGGRGLIWDLHRDDPLPPGDTLIMQASLYQFLPDPAPVLRRMLAAASERVVIAEPIRNLSTSRITPLAAFARRQADAGLGDQPRRFTESSLDALFDGLGIRPAHSFRTPGGREKVYVFE